MKTLHLLAVLAFLPGLAFAQTSTNTTETPPPPPQGQWHHHFGPDQELAHLTEKLQLSSIQQGEIKPILVARGEKMKAIHEDTTLTDEQKHAQMKALFEDTNKQIVQLLNPAQVPLFEQMHQHHGPPPSAPPQQ